MAIATEWIDSRAGSEQVFEAMAQAFPDADLYALTRDPSVELDVGGRPIRTTWLDGGGPWRRSRAATLPLMPLAWHQLSDERYDVVLTSSHAFARWFRPARAAVHLSYVHAPARYLWTPEVDPRTRARPGLVSIAGVPLRRLDRRSVEWTDSFAANSQAIADRIRRFYGRDARVIHPPVAVDDFIVKPVNAAPEPQALFVGRFIAYKQADLAIEACARARIPLVVAGHGPLEQELRAMADGTATTFVVNPDRATLARLFREATVLLHPGEEDFGIVPVEALASGTPVLAFDAGGARDTVVDGVTGRRVAEQTVDAFVDALVSEDWSRHRPSDLRAHAEQWRPERFAAELHDWVAAARAA